VCVWVCVSLSLFLLSAHHYSFISQDQRCDSEGRHLFIRTFTADCVRCAGFSFSLLMSWCAWLLSLSVLSFRFISLRLRSNGESIFWYRLDMPDISDNAAAFLRQLSEEGAKANDKTRLFVDDSSFPDVVAERAVRIFN